MKESLTTGEVANICGVAPRTVAKWFDSHMLNGYRIPGSKTRKIPARELIKFMRDHNIPVQKMVRNNRRILIIDNDLENTEVIKSVFKSELNLDIESTNDNLIRVGSLMAKFEPSIVVIDLDTIQLNLIEFIQTLEEISIIPLKYIITSSDQNKLTDIKFDKLLKPYKCAKLSDLINS